MSGVGGDGPSIGGGAGNHVAASAQMSSWLRNTVDEVRRDPSKELGITAEELERRRKLASSPRSFVSGLTRRPFDVKSSARAQQLMNRGLLERQRETRTRKALQKTATLRRVRVGAFVAGIAIVAWMGVEFLLPQYAAVQERNRLMQRRYEMAQRKREEAEAMKQQ